MNLRVMKRADHYLGLPVCFFLSAVASVITLFRGREIPRPLRPRRILLIKFFGLGSITLLFSMIRDIRRANPGCRIVFLTFSQNAGFIRSQGLCDEVLTVDNTGPLRFIISTLRAVAAMALRRFDVTVDLEYFSKYSTMLSFFSFSRYRIGFHLPNFWRRGLIDIPVPLNFSVHILETYRYISALLGATGAVERWRVAAPRSERVDGILDRLGAGKTLVGINLNASEYALCRRMPLDVLVRAAGALLARYPETRLVLLGSAGERAYVGQLEEKLPEYAARMVNTCGMFTLDELFSCLGRLKFCFSIDSGILQFCYSAGVPTVSIWGPGSPVTHGPLRGETMHRVIYSNPGCSPCLYIYGTEPAFFCRGRSDCLAMVDAETIKREMAAQLEGKACS